MASTPDQPNCDKRSIDERFEALSHFMDLLAHMHQDHAERLANLEALMNRMVNIQESLAAIALDHEARPKCG